jgi:2-polyprenyl-6-methoxyphenol hydroxylase-like FAD-dependent oxidoreductase
MPLSLLVREATETFGLSLQAANGEEWREGEGAPVAGVLYRTPDGAERVASADLTIVCDGMYSSLRSKLSVPNIRCAASTFGCAAGSHPAGALVTENCPASMCRFLHASFFTQPQR